MKKILLLNIFALMLITIQLSAQCTIQVVTTDITMETCVGSSDASATATAGGAGTINYLWSNGQPTAIATNLTTGTYTVTATDDVGCTGTASVEITLDPEGVWLMFTSTAVTCNGGSDGTAHVSVMTGVAPYTYIWNDPVGTTNADPVNLSAGQYTVTVTDSNGCSNYGPVTITEPTAVVISSSTTNETCYGDADGTATASVSGGTPGYTYLWSDGQTTETATNLTTGTYTVTATDNNGCTETATATVDLTNPQIIVSGTSTPVSCFGGSDGSITVSSLGGTGTITYSWSNGQTGSTATNLIAGTYTVTATDGNGCTAIVSETITEPTEVVLTTISVTNVSTNGGNDGTATVDASGGTPPYTYSWSNGQTGATATNLIAGTYTVTVTDSNGCTSTPITIVIEEPPCTSVIILTTSHSNETCVGSMDGHVAVSTSGGVGVMTFLWSNGATTNIVNNLSVGTYTVTVTDETGCTATGTETIELSPEGIWVDITTTNTCFNGSNGTANSVVTTGVAPYTYAWSNGATTANITGLSAGDYTVSVTDSNGCIGIFSTTINEEAQIIATTSHSNETCVGSMDGHVAVSTSGGTGLMTFLWSNGATTDVVNNLSVGTYTVTVTDEAGCTATGTETIELSPEGIWVDITTTNVTCYNGSDGSANSVVTTGVAPYTYAWSNGATTASITGLTAGDYTVSVTDSNGCIGIFSTTITQPTELIATASSTNITCNIPTGTATVSATGGTLPYILYEWSTGEDTQDITDLGVGTYTATVTDANNCTAVSSTTITNTNLTIVVDSVNTMDPSGPGASDGSIDINVIGGNTPYSYLWSNGETTEDIFGLPAGCYTVVVTDGLGVCDTMETICIPLQPNPCMLVVNVTTTNNDCNNDNIGTATATVSQVPDGCTDTMYTYIWTDSLGVSVGGDSAVITGLINGTYLVTVTNGAGVTVTGSGVVTGGGGITSNVTWTNNPCNGDSTGTATVTGMGGTTTYTYLWSTGATTSTITNLIAGTYSVTVTDQNDTTCTSISQVTITDPPVITITTTSTTDPSGPGTSDGSITISVSGGTPGYTYMWSTNNSDDTTATITGLLEGCYIVTVTDALLCMAIDTICIPDPPVMCSLEVMSTPETCNPGNDGTVTASLVGQNCNPASYSYAWEDSDGNSVGSTAMVTGLSEGTYFVTVTDANSLTQSSSVQVTFIDGVVASATSVNVTCNGGNDGSAIASGSGGVPFSDGSYNYLWSNGATTDSVFNLTAGTYTVIVTDSNMLCPDTISVIITQPDPIIITEVITALDCFEDSDASISVTASGGVPYQVGDPYLYDWSTSSSNDTITDLGAGTYFITVTDSLGCTKEEEYIIIQPQEVTVVADPDTSICEDSLQLTASASGGTIITWYNNADLLPASEIGTGSPFDYTNIPYGESTLYVVADSSGCTDMDEVVITSNAFEVTVSPTDSLCVGDVTTLMAVVSPVAAQADVEYLWAPANMFVLGTNTLANPTLISSLSGDFTVYVTTTSLNNPDCQDFDSVMVFIQDTTLNINVDQQCVGYEMTYSSSNGAPMMWDLGDGSSLQGPVASITHTYGDSIMYDVVMYTLPGGNECLPDSVTKQVDVKGDPIFNTSMTLAYDSCTVDTAVLVTFSGTSSNVFNYPNGWSWSLNPDGANTPLGDQQQGTLTVTETGMDSLQLIVTVGDSNGVCMDTIDMIIDINIVDTIPNITACIGDTIGLNPNSNPNYIYNWSPEPPNGNPDSNPMVIANDNMNYVVTITDTGSSQPCDVVVDVALEVHPEIGLEIIADTDTILCADGLVELTATSNVSPDPTYTWFDENDMPLGNGASYDQSVNFEYGIQNISVQAVDEFGCMDEDQITVGQGGIIVALSPITICIGDEAILVPIAESALTPLNYEWIAPDGTMAGMDSTLTVSPNMTTGQYTVNVSNELCDDMAEANVDVIDISATIDSVTAYPSEFLPGESVELKVHTTGNYDYSWTPPGTLDNPNIQIPTANPLEDTDYEVVISQTVSDSLVCSTVSTVSVTTGVCEPPFVFFPNAFSPNGDGMNDELKVYSEVTIEVYFIIYNRWGEKVFEGNSIDDKWDGSFKGETVSSDVYGYYLEVYCIDGEKYTEKGNVTVLK